MTIHITASVIADCQNGDIKAIECVLKQLQSYVYSIAVRMLWNSEDAKDATQEILLKVYRNLLKFNGESQFTTWVYRIAVNYLLNFRKSPMEQQNYSFNRFADELAMGLDEEIQIPTPDGILMVEEIKIGCTLGMLQCLDRAHRCAYILGEILDLTSATCAQIMEVDDATFRQRLARARKKINEFTKTYCGLVNLKADCLCSKRLKTAQEKHYVDKQKLNFVQQNYPCQTLSQVKKTISRLDKARQVTELFRQQLKVPEYQAILDQVAPD